MNGIKLRTTGGMSRMLLLEFFEGCNAVMTLDSTVKVLKVAYNIKKDYKDVGQACIKIQHHILELMGVTKDYGVSVLNSIAADFPANDNELKNKFNSFRMCAEISVKMIGLAPDDKEEFLKEVPRYLRQVPHIYFIQKQRIMEQQQQDQQQYKNTSPELQQHQHNLLNFLNSDEGHTKVSALAIKMDNKRKEMEPIAKLWTNEQRSDYFNKFKTNKIIMELKNCGGDMISRVNLLSDYDDDTFTDIFTMQAVFNADARAGGTLLNELRSSQGSGSEHDNNSTANVGIVMQSISAVSKMAQLPKGSLQMPPGAGASQAHDHSHDHGHSHSHSHDHSHQGQRQQQQPANKPDVTKGKADTIERD